MNNFHIAVSNGLIKGDHRRRMGSAVWEFMWCLDKITMIDKKGMGVILGGRPIKLEEIADQMQVNVNTVSDNLAKLEEEQYITKLRTPYGLVIKVFKAKKSFGKKAKENTEKQDSHNEKQDSHSEKQESNKTIAVDNSNIPIAAKSGEGGNEEKKEYSFEEELLKLKNGGKNGDRNDFKVIALFWKRKGYKFENQKQFNTALGRELRAAKALAGYSGVQVGKAMNWCAMKFPEMWTLETVVKRIPDLINK